MCWNEDSDVDIVTAGKRVFQMREAAAGTAQSLIVWALPTPSWMQIEAVVDARYCKKLRQKIRRSERMLATESESCKTVLNPLWSTQPVKIT
jgi:predicted nucleotidyltransferase